MKIFRGNVLANRVSYEELARQGLAKVTECGEHAARTLEFGVHTDSFVGNNPSSCDILPRNFLQWGIITRLLRPSPMDFCHTRNRACVSIGMEKK